MSVPKFYEAPDFFAGFDCKSPLIFVNGWHIDKPVALFFVKAETGEFIKPKSLNEKYFALMGNISNRGYSLILEYNHIQIGRTDIKPPISIEGLQREMNSFLQLFSNQSIN